MIYHKEEEGEVSPRKKESNVSGGVSDCRYCWRYLLLDTVFPA